MWFLPLILPIMYAVIALILIIAVLTGMLNTLLVGAGLFIMGLMLAENGIKALSISNNKAFPGLMALVGVGLGIWGANIVAPGIVPLAVAGTIGVEPIHQFTINMLPVWLQVTLAGLFIFVGWSRRKDIQKAIKRVLK